MRLNSLSSRVYPALLGALAVLLLGCSANKKPTQIETTLANMAKDVVIPLEAEKLKNPAPATDEVVKQGQEIYVQSCALCHGTDGHGHTELGRAMYPPSMDLTSPHVQAWSDADLYWIVQNGIRLTGMPAWKSSLSDDDAWKLARFIHALPRLDAEAPAEASAPPVPASAESEAALIAYGRTLYRQEGCFMCHLLDGDGGKLGPDLTIEGTRGRANDWLIGHFKDPPAYTQGSIMPPFKNLTQEQLQALTAFLQNQKGR